MADLSPNQVYGAMIQTIIPRPIAWVLSDNGNNSHNLAPFSYFNGVAGDPPLISISIGQKQKGVKKDTWVNIEERSNFVINIASPALAESVTASAASLPFGESEIDAGNIKTTSVENWPLPRVQDCNLAFYCTKHQIIEIGNAPQGLVIGEIKEIYVRDDLLQEKDGRMFIDPKQVDPLGRLGGISYGTLGEAFAVKRPK